jgi:hypothetical protein
MQISYVSRLLCVARITGPTHNHLQLKLTKDPPFALSCDELHAAVSGNQGKLDSGKITEAVRAEVASIMAV